MHFKQKTSLLEYKFKESENTNNPFITKEYFADLLFQVGVDSQIVGIIVKYALETGNKPFVEFSAFLQTINLFTVNSLSKAIFTVLSVETPSKAYVPKEALISRLKAILDEETATSLLEAYKDEIDENEFDSIFPKIESNLISASRVRLLPYFSYHFKPEDRSDEKTCIQLLVEDIYEYTV